MFKPSFRYVSYKTEEDAHLFTVNSKPSFLICFLVENYSEIDWLDYDARTRNTIHRLLEPCLKAQVEDKAMIAKLQRIIEDHNRRVNDIETILFKKDEDERMGLFDSIYNKITENEKARLMEEEKMRDEIGFIRNEVSNNTFTT